MESKPFLFHKLRRLVESPIVILRLFQPLINAWRLAYLHWLARIYGGSIVLGNKLKVTNPTLFQGRGKLVVNDGVLLGFDMAGAHKMSILQPREVGSEIILGRNCAVMNGCEVVARKSIHIGENTRIGPHTLIYDSDFHDVDPESRHLPGKSAPVKIEENVWVGSRVIILKGVCIGKNAIVGAGCVVSRDVPAGSIVAGNPMRVVGTVGRVGIEDRHE